MGWYRTAAIVAALTGVLLSAAASAAVSPPPPRQSSGVLAEPDTGGFLDSGPSDANRIIEPH